LLEESRSTNLQRQAKKWIIKLSKVHTRYHCAPFYLANGIGRLCVHQQGSKSSAKRQTLSENRYNQLSVGALA